jgi:prolyl-tRNA editing enzyme YbaK/EbsC (Cys-tRNA(Pro) deacylase)
VNHRVASEVNFKRLSFASSEETAELSGQEIGGVSIVGLPADIPLLIDALVMERPAVIIGGGNRTSKVRLDPKELSKITNARVASIAIPR